MAIKLEVAYPGKTVVDGNNQFGTFKNRTNDILKDGTPFERGWASDVWGFLAHILKKAGVVPNSAEENETVSQYYDALEGLIGRRDVKFESEDLIINVQSSTTVDADAKRLSLLDSNSIPKFINDLNITFDITTDLEAGTSEKPSTWYGMWLDSDLNKRLVPDLESVTDGTTASKLIDSGATFLTDLVKAGDIVYNLTDLTQTTVSVDAAIEGEVSLTDDIFVSGEDYKIVKMSPEGLGANRERIGAAYNNSGSSLDDSTYTQIQEEKTYSESAGDFTITGPTGWSTLQSFLTPYQTNDWTGKGFWRLRFDVFGTFTITASPTITFPGVTFSPQPSAFSLTSNSTVTIVVMKTVSSSGQLAAQFSGNVTGASYNGDVSLTSKPDFAL